MYENMDVCNRRDCLSDESVVGIDVDNVDDEDRMDVGGCREVGELEMDCIEVEKNVIFVS